MTALEASAQISALLLALFRLGRTTLPVLRLSNHWSAILVCMLIPMLPTVAEQLGAVETKLDLADTLLASVVAGVTAWRGLPKTNVVGVLCLGLVSVFYLQACQGMTMATLAKGAAEHKNTCAAYLEARKVVEAQSEEEKRLFDAADAACKCTVECRSE